MTHHDRSGSPFLTPQLPDECLRRVLLHLPAEQRHRSAAWVSVRWREACVHLALAERSQQQQQQPAIDSVWRHLPLPMCAPVAARVRAVKERIDPQAAPEAWTVRARPDETQRFPTPHTGLMTSIDD
jgi:hypothetical protein